MTMLARSPFPKSRRSQTRIGALLVVLLFALQPLACAPPAENPEPEILVDTLEIGVGFDETVTVVDGTNDPGSGGIASVVLVSDAAGGEFGGRLGVVDEAGNATEVELRVQLSPTAP